MNARRQVGGAMDYERLAALHRPSDPLAINDEIRRLRATGLTAGDISLALRIDIRAVHAALGPPVSPPVFLARFFLEPVEPLQCAGGAFPSLHPHQSFEE